MTFSDSRVVQLVKDSFVAAWESVAPVSIGVFDLGDGRTVRGVMSGEIAIYFCRPDGKVFDILPALQSPHVTYWAIRNALDFYRETGAAEEAIVRYHREQLSAMTASGSGRPSPETSQPPRPDLPRHHARPDARRSHDSTPIVISRVRRKRQRLGPNGSIESDPAVNDGARGVRPRAGSLPIESYR